jgi:hypothetical protein
MYFIKDDFALSLLWIVTLGRKLEHFNASVEYTFLKIR